MVRVGPMHKWVLMGKCRGSSGRGFCFGRGPRPGAGLRSGQHKVPWGRGEESCFLCCASYQQVWM